MVGDISLCRATARHTTAAVAGIGEAARAIEVTWDKSSVVPANIIATASPARQIGMAIRGKVRIWGWALGLCCALVLLVVFVLPAIPPNIRHANELSY